jgi:hypothetical protein
MTKRKRTSNYRLGRAREYRVKKKLYKLGALYVVRSFASKGLFDLTAVFPDHVRLIQVKKSYLSSKERSLLQEFAKKIKRSNIRVELWTTRKGRFVVENLK